MPRQRPAVSGYARLAQADDEDGPLSEGEDDLYNAKTPLSRTWSAIQPGPRESMRSGGNQTPGRRRHTRPMRSNSSGVDLKAINARLERWAEEIASKFKISSVKGKSHEEEQLEIHHSVFQAPEGVRPYTTEQLRAYREGQSDVMTKVQFDEIVENVRVAIEVGTHPKMITKGSSGSYFARNSEGKVVGVFKPKDEEPYANRNPKWTKWLHRNFLPFAFGRGCLIPNLSYVSEAAASVLDMQLRTNIVPRTEVVWLSSPAFFYDFWERWANRRGAALPAKAGSLQVFLKGFKDATEFLRENPWSDQGADFPEHMVEKPKRRSLLRYISGRDVSEDEEESSSQRTHTPPAEEANQAPKFRWTPSLKQSFREELEKLVILDYIMRNTDRGLDNWMLRVDEHKEEVSIVAEPSKPKDNLEPGDASRTKSVSPQRHESNTSKPYRRYEAMESRSGTPSIEDNTQVIKLGAIDNSLSWPWKHPDAWRSFPFGWLFLPVSLIGQPFSQKTRDHFLPLLTSTAWWSETQTALRRVFSLDSDFRESMFARQIAVMKGQAWNVVETLKQHDHGPLELTRRTRVCVWDDLVDVPVAIPLRVPSSEMTRTRKVRIDLSDEEGDIGAAHASAPAVPQIDLLGSPTTEMPNPNRFDLTLRDEGNLDLTNISEEPSSSLPNAHNHEFADLHRAASTNLSHRTPTRPKHKSRFSFDFARSLPSSSNNETSSSSRTGRRQRSMSTRSGNRPAPQGMYDAGGVDLEEGDLGYAAVDGMEKQKRKVIVERLEVVKSKKPFFEWC